MACSYRLSVVCVVLMVLLSGCGGSSGSGTSKPVVSSVSSSVVSVSSSSASASSVSVSSANGSSESSVFSSSSLSSFSSSSASSVSSSPMGELTSALFPEGWQPGFTVNFQGESIGLQDFSYAGYRFGERALPTDRASYTFDLGRDGSAEVRSQLQAAIDLVGEACGCVGEWASGLERGGRPLSSLHSQGGVRVSGRC